MTSTLSEMQLEHARTDLLEFPAETQAKLKRQVTVSCLQKYTVFTIRIQFAIAALGCALNTADFQQQRQSQSPACADGPSNSP